MNQERCSVVWENGRKEIQHRKSKQTEGLKSEGDGPFYTAMRTDLLRESSPLARGSVDV